MTKLHQILAVEKGVKKTTAERVTDAYHLLQKPAVLTGIARTYRKIDEDGVDLPPESTKVQVSATHVLDDVRLELERLWDVTATREWGNTGATADVVIDGLTIISEAPATYLLWLENQLTDLHTLVSKLPTLDPSEDWDWSEELDCYSSKPFQSRTTKKLPRVLVKYEATEQHPAQTEVFPEDVVVGFWETTKFSGALPAQRVREMTSRVDRLREAVRIARAAANNSDIIDRRVASPALEYVFHGGSA